MAKVDCWSYKHLPSNLDEDVLEKILILEGSKSQKLHTKGQERCGGNPGLRELRGVMQRKWKKLGNKIAGTMLSLTQTKVAHEQREEKRNDERKVACNAVIEALMQRHPGSQLPERLILLIKRHFELMPLSYAQAGFNSELVFTHIRLLEQARMEGSNLPSIVVQEMTSRPFNATDCSSSSNSVSSFELSDDEEESTTGVVINFVCSGNLCKSAINWAFKRENLLLKDMQLFVSKSHSLGILQAQGLQKLLHQENVQSVLKAAACRTHLIRLNLGLCRSRSLGHSGAENYNLSKEETTMGNEDKSFDLKGADANLEANRCSFASALTDIPSPGTFLHILLEAEHSMILGDNGMQKWVSDFELLEILQPIKKCSFGTFTVYEGFYNHEKVTAKHWMENDYLLIPALELRRELSILTLPHKNILPFIGFCVDSQHCLYTLTKFMEGGSLQDLIKDKTTIQLRDVHKFSKDVAEGIMHLHQHGIIHGYLTAENVFINKYGDAIVGGTCVSEQPGPKNTASSEEAAYNLMAPEVLSGDSVITAKTDVYSLGIIMDKMLSFWKSHQDSLPWGSGEGAEFECLQSGGACHCFSILKHLSRRCHAVNPLQRPNMPDVFKSLNDIQI